MVMKAVVVEMLEGLGGDEGSVCESAGGVRW
jgi:hypothetical protein